MKKLSELGVDHAYAPDAEPAFFQTLFEQITQFVIDYNEVMWFLAFLMVVLVVFLILRGIWRVLGSLFRRTAHDVDREVERRRRLRLLARSHGIETNPVTGANN